MRPKEIVEAWLDAFNRADVAALTMLYREDAINHQIAESPVEGREAIRAMFEAGFASVHMVCIPENLLRTVIGASWSGGTLRACAGADSSTSLMTKLPSSAGSGTSCRFCGSTTYRHLV